MTSSILDPIQAAKQCKFHVKTLRRWIRQKKVKAKNTGTKAAPKYEVDMASLAAYVEKNRKRLNMYRKGR